MQFRPAESTPKASVKAAHFQLSGGHCDVAGPFCEAMNRQESIFRMFVGSENAKIGKDRASKVALSARKFLTVMLWSIQHRTLSGMSVVPERDSIFAELWMSSANAQTSDDANSNFHS